MENNKHWQRYGETGNLVHASGNAKRCSHSSPSYIFKTIENEYLYRNVHGSIQSQKVETTQMSFN